jgi:hypothetical protein
MLLSTDPFQFSANFYQIAVGGCEFREPDDPGNLQFDWLEVQLKMFRQRGMQVLHTIICSVPF